MKLEEYVAALLYLENKFEGKLKDYWTDIEQWVPKMLLKQSWSVAIEEYVDDRFRKPTY